MYLRTAYGTSKTQDAREWQAQVFHRLSSDENQLKLKELRDNFDSKEHTYCVWICAVYPKSELLTKQGLISSKTQDCSNFEKALIDCFFLPKHHTQESPLGCPNLNIDDKFVTQLISSKGMAKDELSRAIIVDVEIKPMSELNVFEF
jgi:hypothetical protein